MSTSIENPAAYKTWRDAKLAGYPASANDIRVTIADLAVPTEAERAAILDRCRRCGMAIYESAKPLSGDDARAELRRFAATFGLWDIEDHRSADSDGIVAIEVTDQSSKRGFIPYTNRPLNWHTDGYYNGPHEAIRAMILHCVRPASAGGENALLDPEIVYIRLRDQNPALAAAMTHPEAMTIPESVEEDGRTRPTSIGPVFAFDAGGKLTTRYTARARNVIWRDDDDTRAAVAFIDQLLAKEQEPLIIKYTLAAGEGLISNNVLHTRTGFENAAGAERLLLRGRYAKRITGT